LERKEEKEEKTLSHHGKISSKGKGKKGTVYTIPKRKKEKYSREGPCPPERGDEPPPPHKQTIFGGRRKERRHVFRRRGRDLLWPDAKGATWGNEKTKARPYFLKKKKKEEGKGSDPHGQKNQKGVKARKGGEGNPLNKEKRSFPPPWLGGGVGGKENKGKKRKKALHLNRGAKKRGKRPPTNCL